MNNRILLGIIVTNIIITIFHYADNALFVELYPEPEWITTSGVLITWGIMTAIASVSYWLYCQQKYWLSYSTLAVYSLTGLSSPIHYLYGDISNFSIKMDLLIWSDFIVGLSAIVFIAWSGLVKKEWKS
jgi:hypothetical protein